MADFLRFNNDQEMFELRDAGHLSGSLMHLATLEVEQNTYLALGSIQENELGLMAGIVVVRQMEDENGERVFTVVQEENELADLIPRFMEAFLPPGMEMQISGLLGKDELAKKMTIDRDAFVMDYTDYKELET